MTIYLSNVKMGPIKRKQESAFWQYFWANYILGLHAIAAVAVVCFMLKFIDGIAVNFNDKVPWYRRAYLQADDITTVVTAVVVVVRMMTVAWAAKSAWRCALIVLEIQGMTLEQFNRTISWPVYILNGSADAWKATWVLWLLVPANFFSPVITGSVGWRDVAIAVRRSTFQHTGPKATTEGWYLYSIRAGTRVKGLGLSAASRAGVGWLDFGQDSHRASRLVTTSQQRMPVNSTIGNLTLPFLEIHSISWDRKSAFKKNITDELELDWNATSAIALSGERPFNYCHPGNAVLFDERLLGNYPRAKTNDNNSQAALPPPTVFRGIKKIAVLVTRQNATNCTPLGDTIFGNRTSMAKFKDLYSSRDSGFENCFLIGTVNFTAGVIRKQAMYIAPRVVEAERDFSAPIEGDSWVIESVYLLPDVMMKVSLFNVSQIPTWDNLEGSVGDLIRISYQAAWGQVSSQFNASPLNLTAHEYSLGLRAVVSLPRVIVWYFAQFLVLVSAALLWGLQQKSQRPRAADTGVVALLVDPTKVLDRYNDRDLSEMSYVKGNDGGMVKLARHGNSGNGGQDYSGEISERFRLIPDA